MTRPRDYQPAKGRANAADAAPRYSAKPEPVFPVSALTGEYRLSQFRTVGGCAPTPPLLSEQRYHAGGDHAPSSAAREGVGAIEPPFAWREVVSLLIIGAGAFAGMWFLCAAASGLGAS